MNLSVRLVNICNGLLMISLLFLLLPVSSISANSDTLYSATFRVNMSKVVSQHVFEPDSDLVYLIMDHDIGAIQLVQGPDYIYSATIESQFDSGIVYQYKYSINYSPIETVIRSFTATSGGMTFSAWWNNEPLSITTYQVNMKFAAQQQLFNPSVDSVALFGMRNNTPVHLRMIRLDTSLVYTYRDTISPEGTLLSYKYRINQGDTIQGKTELINQPPRFARVPDTICAFLSDYNNVNPAKRAMTFNCDMGYYVKAGHFNIHDDFIDIAGNFNANSRFNVLSDPDGDTIFTTEIQLDTAWITQGPLTFKFRINGDWSNAELSGKPDRSYAFHDTTGLNPNVFTCFYNDLDPAVPTPPWAFNVEIQGLSIYKKFMSGIYGYENVNGIPEGISTYRWLRSTNAQGTDAVAIDSATKITYTVDTLDIGKWVVFEVTPKAASGDSAVGKPVRAISAQISAWDVGISESNSLISRVFPNPASDWIILEARKEIRSVELLNNLNQCTNLKIDASGQRVRASLPQVAPGLYLIKVTATSGQTGFAKLIIE